MKASFGMAALVLAAMLSGAGILVRVLCHEVTRPPAKKIEPREPYVPKPITRDDIYRRESDGGMGASAGALQR